LKIGIFTRPIDQQKSGSGSHLRQLVKHILKLNTEFKFYLIHYSKSDLDIYKNVNEIVLPRNPILASYKLRQYNFDVLHYSPLTAFSPIWGLKAKKIATIHGASELFLPKQYSLLSIFHKKYLVKYYAQKMDYIFTVSKASRSFIHRNYKIPIDKVKLTFNSVSKDYKKLTHLKYNNATHTKYGINNRYILHISKYSERKNPWVILKAFSYFRQLSDENKKMLLILVGSGWDNIEVMNFIRNHNLIDYVILTGFTPKHDVVSLLNLADVFIFPSLYEGCGMPNLEAMACGCPVITSRAFAIPEIVGDAAIKLDDNTNPHELGDKINLLLTDNKLRENLKKKGYERVQLYSWETSANTALSIYRDCIMMDFIRKS
jgi:glycosyltransferase involved in cell wall biosynthesis